MACACFGPSNSKGQMKTIAKNFQLSVSGTDEQQKLAYGKQENDCDTLQVIFKGKEDNIGRMRAIEEGVVEGCIHIFETRELEQITQPFPEAFLVLTEPASTEINLLIYSKKPFQGLVRLLDHKDNRIVADAIRSLINIITAGSDSTPNKEPHPYYQSLQEIGAIEKLFKLQQNNEDKYVKDLAAVCIGVIFKAQELPQYKEQIIEQLKYLLIDNDEWMRNASKKAINCLVQNNVDPKISTNTTSKDVLAGLAHIEDEQIRKDARIGLKLLSEFKGFILFIINVY
ncbi:MAG: hypothetical protein EZS28_026229 [Streblomastix strix]|uniref:Uncharacterized protein n=1 Tax=Streblomastix strix TaxID=222440 RepID=A0A5J4V747_9EUKA|nr:MAG: hypothetical protein EZS28_026229 [Streblomastix strix]